MNEPITIQDLCDCAEEEGRYLPLYFVMRDERGRGREVPVNRCYVDCDPHSQPCCVKLRSYYKSTDGSDFYIVGLSDIENCLRKYFVGETITEEIIQDIINDLDACAVLWGYDDET